MREIDYNTKLEKVRNYGVHCNLLL
jgi:hypothetical protein